MFTCPYGTFAYRRMPFGLCNAPGTFQRCMLVIFHDMVEKTMEVFMDDFSVFGNSFENCLSRLENMLQRCEDTNLSLNWEKSHFMIKEDIVLGHKISKNEIEVDRAKVDVIAKLPHPTTVKGAVLGQRHEKHFKPIHYASKTMNDAESSYTTTEKEMLAVVAPWFADFVNYHAGNFIVKALRGDTQHLSMGDFGMYGRFWKRILKKQTKTKPKMTKPNTKWKRLEKTKSFEAGSQKSKPEERMITDIDKDADVVLEEAKDVAADPKDDQDTNVQVNVDIQGRTAESQAEIYKIDLDHANKVLSMQEEKSEPTEFQEVVDIVTTVKIITEVVTAASTTITVADVPIPAATTTATPTLTAAPSRRTKGVVIRDHEESTTTTFTIIHSEAKSKDNGKGILVEEPKPLKKQDQIKQDEKYARELEAELNRTIDWDEAIDHVNKKVKEDKSVKRYQAIKRKPQTEAQARKNMMVYLKNVAGFKMDYFKGISYDDIRPIFEKHFDSNVAFLQKIKEQIDEEESRALKRINETLAKKAAKRQKLIEEVEELKRHLQIVPNEDDDFYTEATPLARKKNQRSVHGQAKVKSWKLLESCGVQIITFTTTQLILLVERKYPLTRFTLDQILNNVRLEVEAESEVSLELLSFIRQQHQEGAQLE
nr:reverse transcriptase domain-containing protein [Tanacetum cinerariifolium]